MPVNSSSLLHVIYALVNSRQGSAAPRLARRTALVSSPRTSASVGLHYPPHFTLACRSKVCNSLLLLGTEPRSLCRTDKNSIRKQKTNRCQELARKNSSENKKFAHPSITESAVSQTLAISQFTLSSTLDFALVRPPWAADMLKPPLRWHQSAFITLDVSYEKEKSSSRHSSVIGRSVQHWHPHQTPVLPAGRFY